MHKTKALFRVDELIQSNSLSYKNWKNAIDKLQDNSEETLLILKYIIQKKPQYNKALDLAIDKISKQNKKNQDNMAPYLENLLQYDCYFKFYPETRKNIILIFSSIEPENKFLLNILQRILSNPVNIELHKTALIIIDKISKNQNTSEQTIKYIYKIKQDYLLRTSKELSLKIPGHILQKAQLSRTITGGLSENSLAFDNFVAAYKYVYNNYSNKYCPQIKDLIKIHRLLTKGLTNSQYEKWSGVLRGRYWEDRKKFINGHYTDFEKVHSEVKNFSNWLKANHQKLSPFELASNVYKKLVDIHPFYDANGRTARLYVEWILLYRGYIMEQYPLDFATTTDFSSEELSKLIMQNSKQIL